MRCWIWDMGNAACASAGQKEAAPMLQHHELIRVATKYPNIAKDYFYNAKHQTVEIIKLNGSIELAPIVGLSEVIVDIVETGSTLRENGLSGPGGGLPPFRQDDRQSGEHEDGERTDPAASDADCGQASNRSMTGKKWREGP